MGHCRLHCYLRGYYWILKKLAFKLNEYDQCMTNKNIIAHNLPISGM